MPETKLYTTEELLIQVAAGDEPAFRELVIRFSGLLYTYVYKHIESREITEELVQDVFTQIWLTREALSEVRNFRTYLYVVSRNQALNALKKMSRDFHKQMQYQQLELVHEPDEDRMNREMQLSVIEEAIEKLPPRQKRAWILSRREKLTYQQVAQEMDISRETVKTYLQHANQFIGKYLTERMSALVIFWLMK
ncbi:MAG: RNA polymerase sigma factor [Pseudobacter sp.]|uniref:RNA polymerase sigma factor n=1 Tax=Pseudobacter sp. TaxID=2045420 RepID=UPI003F7F5F55